MNLVYKEDVVLRQIGEQRGQIAGLLDGGAGGDADIDPHLVGNDAAEGGFAQAGRAVKQNVVQGSPRILAAWIKTSRLPWPSPARYTPAVLGRREPSFSSSRVSDVVTSGSWVSNPVSEKSMLKYVHFLILT